MTIVEDVQNGVAEAMKYGELVRIKFFNTAYDADSYDDDVTLTQSGVDFWTSGIVLPISNARGSSDAVLLEQGKIVMDDTKLYVDGSVLTSGTLKIGLGSYFNMSGAEYSLLSEGVTKWEVNDTDILKKLYVRMLTNGSLIGEA